MVAVAVKGLERWGEVQGTTKETTSQGQGEGPRSGATNRPSVPATGAEECATSVAEGVRHYRRRKNTKSGATNLPPKISGSTPGKAKLLETFLKH